MIHQLQQQLINVLAYNLLQACAACQGASSGFISTWAGWDSPSCGNFHSNEEYFPHDIAIASGTALPAWAATNPKSWPNQQFNAEAARQLALQGRFLKLDEFVSLISSPGTPDISTIPQSTPKSSPVGPIVGGVVGGVAVIGIACAVFILLRLRRRRNSNGTSAGLDSDDGHDAVQTLPAKPQHARGLSAESKQSLTSGYLSTGYTPATSPSFIATHNTALSSPTQLGHSDDLHSQYPMSPSLFSTPSPIMPPVSIPTASGPLPEGGFITPFTAIGPSLPNDARSEKSRLEGAHLTVYDHPTTPPSVYAETRIADSRPSTPGIGPSRRFNPPGYVPPAPSSPLAQQLEFDLPAYSPSETSSSPRPRREKGSADSHGSDSSGAGGPAFTARGTHVRSMSEGTIGARSLDSMSDMGGITSRFHVEAEGTATQSGLETGNSAVLHHLTTRNDGPVI
ncbi:hypothetical protein ONZ45_g4071 [Pleurotus djamor]|nr:hypothetical protein ONZ45_g4071 [Pleurotus djamor]